MSGVPEGGVAVPVAVAVSVADGVNVHVADGEDAGVGACEPLALDEAGVDGVHEADAEAEAPKDRLAVAVPDEEPVLVFDGSSLPPAPTE